MRKLNLWVALIMCSASVGTASVITWGYGADLGSGYTDGWLVELIEDVGKDGISIGGLAGSGSVMWDDRTLDGDDRFIDTPVQTVLATAWGWRGYSDTFSSPGSSIALGDNVYTVIYNASTFGAATEYIIVDSAPYALPSTDVPNTYSLTSVSGSWAPIVAVPEPGSIALFALGLVTLVARRKRR